MVVRYKHTQWQWSIHWNMVKAVNFWLSVFYHIKKNWKTKLHTCKRTTEKRRNMSTNNLEKIPISEKTKHISFHDGWLQKLNPSCESKRNDLDVRPCNQHPDRLKIFTTPRDELSHTYGRQWGWSKFIIKMASILYAPLYLCSLQYECEIPAIRKHILSSPLDSGLILWLAWVHTMQVRWWLANPKLQFQETLCTSTLSWISATTTWTSLGRLAEESETT